MDWGRRDTVCVGPVFRLGVTGGIAEGKSTVLSGLRGLGVRTASADEIVRNLWDDGSIPESLGPLFGGRKVSKKEVLDALSSDPRVRRAVNAATHGLVMARLAETGAEAVEVPLLVETCLMGLFRRVWVVTCGPDEQLRRLTERLGDGAAAARAVRAQLPTRAKVPFADAVVRTNGSPSSVLTAVERTARAHGLV
ncbi:MAG: dephospho-CoA kinase [Armatimonadetes bacterium]|nr:dephospho-CoA kinase [Armatimonadota bacterium]